MRLRAAGRCDRPARRAAAAALLCAASLAAAAQAREGCDGRARLASESTTNVRFDNDMFGGAGQDQGYTNGFMVTNVSPNLVDYRDDPCLPGIVRRLNRYLAWLQPGGYDEQNMTLGFGQALFTPADPKRADLVADDRPYAAALLVGSGYNARKGGHLRTSQIRVGIVGPSALGEQVQNGWHDLIGSQRFLGWDHQLRDEPVLQLVHERRRRWQRRESPAGWGWDAVGHWGGSLGNFATYANTGMEWRFGYRLPDDFGTAPLRPAGENMAPVASPGRDAGWAAHLFLAFDARWVLHDITLDGNTFKSSHSVDRRPLVADVGYGLAVTRGRWKFAFARSHRTREFEGQREAPVYGSFTISKRF
ncbi:lipid A deacylase LpxR family protein [Luteimonas sp. Y-2-2-4F]|nr:lipid A deacylase LpxR family protein [Luteimonas sp. Y-2-2-4F]MCD9033231.1 lipid A deacylase LpxR family protein [Luteimonas sp. Y-2-2-4F]